MNIAIARNFGTAENNEAPYSPIHAFFEEHRDALASAARLLGGREAVNLVEDIIDALHRDYDLTRRTIERLHDLEDLLALENVGDPGRAETGHFAAIDILDPVVEEICLLTDALHTAIATLPLRQGAPGTVAYSGASSRPSSSRSRLADTLVFPARGMGDAK